MWLRKANAGSAPGYTWGHDGDVIEVPDELALELLERPGGEFTEVPASEVPSEELGEPSVPSAGEPAGEEKSPPEEAQDAKDAAEVTEAPAPTPAATKRRTRKDTAAEVAD